MKRAKVSIVLPMALLVSACADSLPIDKSVESLRGQIASVERNTQKLHESLPENCRTAAVEVQFENLQEQIDNLYTQVENVYDLHKTEVESMETDYNILVIFFIILFLAVVLI